MAKIAPLHPGEVLLEEFMKPHGLSGNALAQRLNVPANRISSVVNGSRSITADTALRLARAFQTTPEFWLNLQKAHDLDIARDQASDLGRIKPVAA